MLKAKVLNEEVFDGGGGGVGGFLVSSLVNADGSLCGMKRPN